MGDERSWLTRQTGVALGERLKAAWEWAAVMGQLEIYGWQTLDIRCLTRRPPLPPLPAPWILVLCMCCLFYYNY